MNKIASAVVLALGVVAFGASAAPANQGSGTVTFTGSIIDAPCSINPDDADQTIDLGQISNKALEKSGTSTPRIFQIHLENCSLSADPDAENTVALTFGGMSADDNNDLLAITGDAGGAGVAITGMDGKQIVLGAETAAQNLIEGDNNLMFSAYLKGLGGTITPGQFQAVSNWTMNYQ